MPVAGALAEDADRTAFDHQKWVDSLTTVGGQIPDLWTARSGVGHRDIDILFIRAA